MRIAIDLTALMPRTTGVDTYLVEIVRHLAQLDRENRYTIFMNFADRGRFDGALGANFAIRAICPQNRPSRLLFQQGVLPLTSVMYGYDVIHSPSFLMPLWRGRSRHLLTVHDMTFFSMPGLHNWLRKSAAFRKIVAMSIQRASMINVPSQTTRRDLLHWFPAVSPERVRITAYGVSPRFCPAPRGEVLAQVVRLGLPSPYILYVGAIEPRKNIETLIDSYERLVSAGKIREHLVLAGPLSWDYAGILRRMESPELKGRIHLIGYVADADLPWVYRGASMLVYPSLYEGFGLPPLEAMASGIPVISSDRASMEEYLRGAAELVAPENASALAVAIDRLASDCEWRARLIALGLKRAAGFGWDETARGILECYRELA